MDPKQAQTQALKAKRAAEGENITAAKGGYKTFMRNSGGKYHLARLEELKKTALSEAQKSTDPYKMMKLMGMAFAYDQMIAHFGRMTQ